MRSLCSDKIEWFRNDFSKKNLIELMKKHHNVYCGNLEIICAFD